ncbi:MAG: hypothetical protein AAGA20_09525 [Planctomycetota bacterium]
MRIVRAALPALAALFVACAEEDVGGPPPWNGSLRDGLAQIEALADEGAFDDAIETADRVVAPDGLARARRWLERATRGASESALAPITSGLDAIGVDALSDADRAEVEFARGLVLLRSTQVAPVDGGDAEAAEDAAGRYRRAIDAFERARAAGGDARLDAVYNLGTLDLLQAEAIRATIPEISGESGAMPMPGAEKNDEDPVDLARRAYLAARVHFIERLQLEGEADARANVELVLRRLRELDDIERQREEEQQQQDQQEGEPQEDSGEQSEEQQDQQQDENQEQQDSDGESESEEGEQDPSDEASEGEEEEAEPQEGEEEEAAAEEQGEDEEEAPDDESEGEGEEADEKVLTAEEIKRFLEQNREYQENGEKLRRLLRLRRKIPTRRDW